MPGWRRGPLWAASDSRALRPTGLLRPAPQCGSRSRPRTDSRVFAAVLPWSCYSFSEGRAMPEPVYGCGWKYQMPDLHLVLPQVVVTSQLALCPTDHKPGMNPMQLRKPEYVAFARNRAVPIHP